MAVAGSGASAAFVLRTTPGVITSGASAAFAERTTGVAGSTVSPDAAFVATVRVGVLFELEAHRESEATRTIVATAAATATRVLPPRSKGSLADRLGRARGGDIEVRVNIATSSALRAEVVPHHRISVRPSCLRVHRAGHERAVTGESAGTRVHRRLPYPSRHAAHVCGSEAALLPRAVGVDVALVEQRGSELHCVMLHGFVSFVGVVLPASVTDTTTVRRRRPRRLGCEVARMWRIDGSGAAVTSTP